MSQRAAQYGKVTFFFSLALLAGLSITQQMLEAHSADEPVVSIDQIATQNALQFVDGDEFLDNLEEKIRRADQEREMLTLGSREFKLFLQVQGKRGTPVALLALGKLHGVDRKGNIFDLAKDECLPNLPVLTGAGMRFNTKSKRLDGLLFRQAMDFISEVDSRSDLLCQKLSEVNCDPELGLVAYFSQIGELPVLIGQDALEAKAKNLDLFFEQLGPSTLMGNIKYLDARLANQIIIKKIKA